MVSFLRLAMQIMRALFRRSTESGSSTQISNVFVVPGHVFISSTSHPSTPQGDHHCLHGVSLLVPREFRFMHAKGLSEMSLANIHCAWGRYH